MARSRSTATTPQSQATCSDRAQARARAALRPRGDRRAARRVRERACVTRDITRRAAAIAVDFSEEEHVRQPDGRRGSRAARPRGVRRRSAAGEPAKRRSCPFARSEASISICSKTPAATSRTILRQQGYRSAEAPYVREERARRDGVDLHCHAAARCTGWHRSMSPATRGAARSARAAAGAEAGGAFVDSRIATVASAVTELYRVRGFARATVKPEIDVVPDAERLTARSTGPSPCASSSPRGSRRRSTR